MRNKQMSLARQIKRGHVVGKINQLTGFLEFFRRTATSKKHTVFVGSFKLG